jgi:hypothetical protein
MRREIDFHLTMAMPTEAHQRTIDKVVIAVVALQKLRQVFDM